MIAESGSHSYLQPIFLISAPTTSLLFPHSIQFYVYIYTSKPCSQLSHAPPFFATFHFSIPRRNAILVPCHTHPIPLLSPHPDWSSRRFWPNLNTKGTELLLEEALEGILFFLHFIKQISSILKHLFIYFLYQERFEELGSLPNVGSLLR